MVFATEFDPTDRAVRDRTSPAASVTPIATGNRHYQHAILATAPSHSHSVALKSHSHSVALTNDLRGSLADDWGDDFNGEALRSRGVTAEAAFDNDRLGNVVPLNPAHLQPGPELRIGRSAVRVRRDENRSLSSLPKHPKLPLRLQILNRLQQGSTVVTTLLVTGALAMYGSTVYVDKSTHRALLQLDSLQGESQQLTSANESIKQSLAEQAIKEDSGLELYEAGDVLFLAPEPLREGAAPVKPMADMPGPLGY